MDLNGDSEDEEPQPVQLSSPSVVSSLGSDSDDDDDDLTLPTAPAPAEGDVTGTMRVAENGDDATRTAGSSYLSSLSSRHALYAPPSSFPASYSLQTIATIPHATSIHSLAVPPCCSHIYTGGADGFIRRYALHPMLNNNASEGVGFNNLTMKSSSNAASRGEGEKGEGKEVQVGPPVLVGYWENDEMGSWVDELGKVEGGGKWGAKSPTMAAVGQSPVYSLAVQRDELWGLSGTAVGSINLFTIRHDEGQIRHVFRPSEIPTAGHRANSPVSVLTLSSDESWFLSGGWDSRILEWDLNTGVAVRSYAGHTSQISSLTFRPPSPTPSTSMDVDPPAPASTSPLSSGSSSNGIAAALVAPSLSGHPSPRYSEADADGEADDDPPAPLPPTNSIPKMGAKGLPELSRDVFLSTSIDGVVLVWDRRVAEGGGRVRRLDNEGRHGGWCASASWSANGNEIHVGRRSSVLETYSLLSPSPTRTIRLPSDSGPVSAIRSLPGGSQLVVGSTDNLRVWDLEKEAQGEGRKGLAFRIVAGHQGGVVSSLLVDPKAEFLFSTSGNRGWEGTSTENLIVHEIKTVY